MTQIETLPEAKPPDRSRGPLIAAAVAAVVLIATIGILLTNRDEQPVVSPVVPTTSAVVPTTIASLEGITPEEALSVADSYFTAFNAGDTDAVLALFTPDVVVSEGYQGAASVSETNFTEWVIFLTWEAAQETTYPQPECQVTDQTPDDVTVVCETDNLQGMARAVNSPGVPTTITMVVGTGGIESLSSLFDISTISWPDLNDPFDAWMAAQFPEDPLAAVATGDWTSREEAEQNGLLRVQRAEEWVSFATGAVEQAFADFNAGDLEGFLSRFQSSTAILDVAPSDARDVFAAQMAAGTQYSVDGCVTNGVSAFRLLIECAITTTDGSTSTDATVSMGVSASGTIGTSAITND